MQQQDAQEFLNMLLMALEGTMAPEQYSAVASLISGKGQRELKCTECGTERCIDEVVAQLRHQCSRIRCSLEQRACIAQK